MGYHAIVIEVHNLRKSFDGGATYALCDVSLTVAEGETLVLLGSSGSGKTTLLKMINRLIEPTSGTVSVNGREVRTLDAVRLRRAVGYVFQGIGLFSHLTVAQNVEVVPRLLGWSARARGRRARELLDRVGLPPDVFATRLPEELSGGEQQRVGVARALAADPDYLLMDEPFGALDALTRDTLQQELLALKRELGKTIVFVTHDMFEALTLADRIAVLHHGHLEQVDTREELLRRPATPFVKELFAKPARQLAGLTQVD